jgi:hypothetical protein
VTGCCECGDELPGSGATKLNKRESMSGSEAVNSSS